MDMGQQGLADLHQTVQRQDIRRGAQQAPRQDTQNVHALSRATHTAVHRGLENVNGGNRHFQSESIPFLNIMFRNPVRIKVKGNATRWMTDNAKTVFRYGSVSCSTQVRQAAKGLLRRNCAAGQIAVKTVLQSVICESRDTCWFEMCRKN